MTDRTFVLIKPDGVRRGLVIEVIHTLRSWGLTPLWAAVGRMTPEMVHGLYANKRDHPDYWDLAHFMMSGLCIAVACRGRDAVRAGRIAVQDIRSRHATSVRCNVVHASDTPEHAAYEQSLFQEWRIS